MNMQNYDVVKGLIFHNDDALLLERPNFIGARYDVPGGRKLSPLEKDYDALQREVFEEVGMKIDIERILNEWTLDLPQLELHLNGKTYLCYSDSKIVRLSKEHVSYIWIPRKYLQYQDIPNWLKEALLKI